MKLKQFSSREILRLAVLGANKMLQTAQFPKNAKMCVSLWSASSGLGLNGVSQAAVAFVNVLG